MKITSNAYFIQCQPSEWISYAQVWILALTSVALQIYQQQTLHSSFSSIYCIYTYLHTSDASSYSNQPNEIQNDVFNMYCTLYFVCNMFCVLFAQNMMLQTICSIKLDSEIKAVEQRFPPSITVCWIKQCWLSAFLNITYSTCLDCTLPVTKTFCFTFMTGFTFLMITVMQKCECEFLFYNFVPKAGFFICIFLIWKLNALFVLAFILAVHPLLMFSNQNVC